MRCGYCDRTIRRSHHWSIIVMNEWAQSNGENLLSMLDQTKCFEWQSNGSVNIKFCRLDARLSRATICHKYQLKPFLIGFLFSTLSSKWEKQIMMSASARSVSSHNIYIRAILMFIIEYMLTHYSHAVKITTRLLRPTEDGHMPRRGEKNIFFFPWKKKNDINSISCLSNYI